MYLIEYSNIRQGKINYTYDALYDVWRLLRESKHFQNIIMCPKHIDVFKLSNLFKIINIKITFVSIAYYCGTKSRFSGTICINIVHDCFEGCVINSTVARQIIEGLKLDPRESQDIIPHWSSPTDFKGLIDTPFDLVG